MRSTTGLTVAACLAAASFTHAGDAMPESVLSEQITVTAGRLPDESEDAGRVPANVTVISREEIERSGWDDLGDLLAMQASAVLYDQTGNGVQTTFDLRGFGSGSGTRVFLDGVPLNDAINDTLDVELIPLEALERVEITRGSAAALTGGGSEAGVIHLITRRGEELGGAVSTAFGRDDTSDVGGHFSQAAGPFDYLIAARRYETDGFRENADGDLQRLSAHVGLDLGQERRLGLTLVDSRSEFGNPGALNRTELAQNPSISPYNALDYADERLDVASLGFRGPLAPRLNLAANLFLRDRTTESLTTGRIAATPAFGGSAFESDASFWGSVVQLTHRHRAQDRANALTVGGEWLDGETDFLKFSTPADDPGTIPASPATRASSGRRTSALFVQETWSRGSHWSVMAGARYDHDRVRLAQSLPDPTGSGARRFSELSLRAGVSWSPLDAHTVYVSYGEGFLPPSSEELFAFPGFGSNPGLDPEASRSYELGLRSRGSQAFSWNATLFRIDTQDEIVFDPDSPLGLFGANVNAGESRRQGAEISLRGRPSRRTAFTTDLTLTDAEFTSGASAGKDVPLVPDRRLAVGLDVALAAGLSVHGDLLFVGEQVLDNDDANGQPKLDDYVVVNARLTWKLAAISTPRNGLRLFVEARNLLDEEYVTRGIYAYDWLSGVNDVFLTPAPDRRTTFGAEWMF